MRMCKAMTAASANQIMDAAKAEARKNGWAVSIAIVDQAGTLWKLDRADGAALQTPKIAEAKASTAALMRVPTKTLEDRAKDRLVMLGLRDLLFMQGGLPIIIDGECVGAVGVSGAKAAEDEQVAHAGISGLVEP